MGNTTKIGLNQIGKDYVTKKFEEKFQKKFLWIRFKNKYDVCRRSYIRYKILLHNRTGITFDAFGRIDMADDWWNERIKEWPDAVKYKNKLLPNQDVFRDAFCSVIVTGAEGWSAQQGETSLNSRVDAENGDEADSVDTSMAPPVVGTQFRVGSSRSKRKQKEVDIATKTSSSRNLILTRKNELVEKMLERDDSCSVVRVVEILNELPGVRMWSRFHKASVDHLLADVANRQGFIAFFSIEDKISYLEHRTGISIDD
ncbi:PREDICTED: uncharacterized protein LOC104737045 isoform X2 [Camelina sativa]|nr:PREDICTED: uncharacterized protein LOC104737045 isoform X2 [Camelina sativa]